MFWKVSRLASLPQKNGFLFDDQIWHDKALYQYSITRKTRFTFLTDFETSLQENPIWEESFRKVSKFASLIPEKWFCIC